MYEEVSHSLLNDILKELTPRLGGHDLYHFYIRIGANFYAIYSLFYRLYGTHPQFKEQIVRLVETLANNYINRDAALREKDLAREKHYNWFQEQKWTGMTLYTSGFSGDLKGLVDKVHYFEDLGVNLVHVMPILKCPEGKSDGGYAVSNFRQLDSRAGTLDDLEAVSRAFKESGILLVLDVVVNHTSNEHEWAQKAVDGDPEYQDYFYLYDDREIPDRFEETMLEVFPTSSPGNFTWNEDMQKWVMTVFHDYQWDLNYTNPSVFIEMIDIILYWANMGADVIRLDAVAFLWKKIGTTCQNEREAHLLLQLMKDCCQVSAPGVLFIAEAIVAPVEINKYFGEDAVIAKECEIAYNATLMALLWDAIATRNSKLLDEGIANLPVKLERATWLNYVRCHDDIGLGFADSDIVQAGYEPFAHRRFLVDYYTGGYDTSPSRGLPFASNKKTGDVRISGSLASLVGLESALDARDEAAVSAAIKRILLLHSIILSFGGIPLIYYGDELGILNNYAALEDAGKAGDSRWIHRPVIDWERAERRHQQGTEEYFIFTALKKMIAIRREVNAFADFNNRELFDTDNEYIFGYLRFHPRNTGEQVMVLANFDEASHTIDLESMRSYGFNWPENLYDLITGVRPERKGDAIVVPPLQSYWLVY